jgi:membrane protein involved in colicin uptake
MIFNTSATKKKAGQKLAASYLLNELWSDLDDAPQAAVSGGGFSSDNRRANDERGAGAIAFVSPKS